MKLCKQGNNLLCNSKNLLLKRNDASLLKYRGRFTVSNYLIKKSRNSYYSFAFLIAHF